MEASRERTVIAGRYELESLIGEGGMGSVWRAQDLTLARPVALKLLFSRDERDRSRMVKRFLREARIAASVQHRNVIHIVDFGTTDSGQPFMVMELLKGETLTERLDRSPPLDVATFINIVGMTLRGLGAVHDAGIVHRDLKPDNIFLTNQDSRMFPKILDFGISRSMGPASGRRSALTTKDGLIVGTPEYMSPEQARGVRNIDHRADVYSAGVVLYEGLTGHLPFTSEHVGDLIIQIVTSTPPRVDAINGSVPKSLADVVEKAMAHDPGDRFQSAQQMQQALLELAARSTVGQFGRPLSERPPRPGLDFDKALPLLKVNLTGGTDSAPRPSPVLKGGPAPLPPAANGSLRTSAPAPAGAQTTSPQTGIARVLFSAVSGLMLVSGAAVSATYVEDDREPIVNALPDTHIAGKLAPTEVTVALVGMPENAQVRVNGEATSTLPLRFPRDGEVRVITVHAVGMLPFEARVAPRHDTELPVTLSPAPKQRRKARRAQRRPRTRQQQRASTTKRRSERKDTKASRPRALRTLDF
ncbi:MAG: serine/threonine-protein kinase [Myxococcales bacterium]|nr:serine/threonine-protein kinase [Myxococcales bacterium]MDD9965949.1 serine/threonine-protein kinase [Myxococcales bacterium]